MKYRLEFHPGARIEIFQIGDWIADFSGRRVANKITRDIQSAINSLRTWPERGNLQPHIGPKIRAIPVGEKAVITFEVDQEHRIVLIYTVTDGGQDWESRTRDRL